MPAAAGDLAHIGGIEIAVRKASGTVTKGRIVGFDTVGKIVNADTADTIFRGYGVARISGVNNDFLSIAVGNTYIYVAGGGTIIVNNLVKADASGKAVSHAEPTANGAPTTAEVQAVIDGFAFTVGRYIAHENETGGTNQNPTDATTANVLIVRLGL